MWRRHCLNSVTHAQNAAATVGIIFWNPLLILLILLFPCLSSFSFKIFKSSTVCVKFTWDFMETRQLLTIRFYWFFYYNLGRHGGAVSQQESCSFHLGPFLGWVFIFFVSALVLYRFYGFLSHSKNKHLHDLSCVRVWRLLSLCCFCTPFKCGGNMSSVLMEHQQVWEAMNIYLIISMAMNLGD